MSRALLLSLAAVVCVGCVVPPEGRFACSASSDCPSGWVCRADRLCWSTGSGGFPDGGWEDSGRPDATLDATVDGALEPVDSAGLDAGNCVDSNDPDHCGSCGHVCITPDRGARVCRDGTCGNTCPAPYVEVPSWDGSMQTPRCSLFGGIYVRGDTAGLPCITPNPFTADCSCPAGFQDRDATSWRTTLEGAEMGRLHACRIATSPKAPDPFWSGIYIINEGAPGSPCILTNPSGATGLGCDCYMGMPATAHLYGRNSLGERLNVAFCAHGLDPAGTFAHAYTEGGIRCAGECVTGDCTCPMGTTAVVFPSVGATSELCATDSVLCLPPF